MFAINFSITVQVGGYSFSLLRRFLGAQSRLCGSVETLSELLLSHLKCVLGSTVVMNSLEVHVLLAL